MRPTPKAKRARKETTMKTTTSSVRFTINFFNKTITSTKASFNKAGKGFGPEYEELAAKMAAHPDFTLEVKEQKHKTIKAKKTYDGLDFKFMEDYIATLDHSKAMIVEYKAVKQMAKDCGTKTYPLTKKWFLGKFGTEEQPFDMEEAKEKIRKFRLAKAAELAAKNLTIVPVAAADEQDEDEAA